MTEASPLLLPFSNERHQRSRTRARSHRMSQLSSRGRIRSQVDRKAEQLHHLKQQNRSSQSCKGISLAHQAGSIQKLSHLLDMLLLGGRMMSSQGARCTATPSEWSMPRAHPTKHDAETLQDLVYLFMWMLYHAVVSIGPQM